MENTTANSENISKGNSLLRQAGFWANIIVLFSFIEIAMTLSQFYTLSHYYFEDGFGNIPSLFEKGFITTSVDLILILISTFILIYFYRMTKRENSDQNTWVNIFILFKRYLILLCIMSIVWIIYSFYYLLLK